MVHFVEPLATEQLWHWLEEERGWRVDSEVDTGNGRIDLACETPGGRYVGIELKAGSGVSWGAQLAEQLWRYIDSERFDAVYFASPTVEKIAERLASDDVAPQIPVISRASRKLRAGIQDGQYTAEDALQRIEQEIDPEILFYEFSGGRRTVRSYIRRHLEDRTERSLDPISIDEGIRDISRSVLPEDIGLIEVPLPLEGGYLQSPRMALTPDEINDPEITREPDQLQRTAPPTFSPEEEPWIRHAAWEAFGGLPEGSIPNVMESQRLDRPIDLVAFENSWDPTAILESGTGAVIGVEAKGRGSFSTNRILTQLEECLETRSFSRLYLAVPETLEDRAVELLSTHDAVTMVGVLTVDYDRNVRIARDADPLPLEHDGYRNGDALCKTGYGSIRIRDGKDVTSPFILSEWRDPLTDDAGNDVVWEYDPRETDAVIHDVDDLDLTSPDEPREKLKSQGRNASTARAYLLTGHSAAPYVTGEAHGRREPKYGYVRLSVTDFETDDGEYALDLHFGAGGWEGGYICFVGEQVDALVSVLSSLEHVPQAQVPGQGQIIDLATFNWEYGENYEFKLGHDANDEQRLSLDIETTRTDDGVGALLRLGEELQQGVEVTMTEAQRIDFLRTLRIMRFGRPSELPGDGSGYQRVGPDGTDTWDRGTDVEKEHNPPELLDQSSAEATAKQPQPASANQPDSTQDGTSDSSGESSTLLDRVLSWLQ